MYQVVGTDGQIYGPVDVDTLKQWAGDSRLQPHMMMIDPITGVTLPAAQMLATYDVFAPAVPPVSVPNAAVTLAPATATYSVARPAQAEAAGLARRFGAYTVDAIISIPLQLLALIPFVGILFAPLLCLYWLSRDSLFGGQSLGKKLMGIRAVRLDGGPFKWSHSMQRNIFALSMLVQLVPFIGYVGFVLGVGGALVDGVLVAVTGRRMGDHLSNTIVVPA